MIVIDDPKIVERLQARAAREQRSVNEVITTMLDSNPVAEDLPPNPSLQETTAEKMRRIRLRAFAKARTYWAANGNAERAAMSDKELDEKFAVFDGDVPLLLEDIDWDNPPRGWGRIVAAKMRESNFRSGDPKWAERSIDSMKNDFAPRVRESDE